MNINDDILYKIDSEIGKDKKVVELQREIERLNQEIRCLNNCIIEFHSEFCNKQAEINRLNNKYNKALELLIDYNLPCEVDDFMNVYSDYCETHCGVDEEQYKRCWDKFIEWKLGSDKE